MRAGGADREDFGAAARQQHRLFPDLPDQHRAVGKIALRDSGGEVGILRLVCVCHMILPGKARRGCAVSRRRPLP